MSISVPLLVVLLLVVLAIGCALGYLFARVQAVGAPEQDARELAAIQSSAAAAQARAERLEEENNALIDRAKSDQDIMRALAPLTQQLDSMNRRVQGMQEAQAAQRSQLHEQLDHAALTQRELAKETHSLRTALTSNSARGTWGEVELRRIVEAAGMLSHVDFDTQQATSLVSDAGSSARPDLTVHLPGGFHLAIDAKVPLSALLKAQAITGEDPAAQATRQQLLKDHSKAVRTHVNELVKRDYPGEFPGSPNLTVMFMPAESLLSEALKADPSLLDEALAAGIAPTSPCSLLALLRSIATVWSSAKVTEEAQGIMMLGRTLVSRLNTVAGHLDTLGASLQRSVTAYNKTVASIESRLLVTARSFESIDSSLTSPHELSSEKAQVRAFTAGALAIEGNEVRNDISENTIREGS